LGHSRCTSGHRYHYKGGELDKGGELGRRRSAGLAAAGSGAS